MKGGPWSQDEDNQLLELAWKGKTWEAISKHFPGRTRDGCRTRYRDQVQPKDELAQQYQTMVEMFVKYEGDKSVLEPITQDELKLKNLKEMDKLLHNLEDNLRKLLCNRLKIKLDTQRSVYLLEQMIKSKNEKP